MKNIKEAVKKVNEGLLQKRAGGFADSIGAGITSPTLMNLHPVTGIERLLAAVGDDPSKEEIKGYDKNPIPSLLVGPYRDIRRRREMLSRAGKDAGYHVAAEELANPGLGWAALLGGLGVGQFALREHLADKAGDKARAEYIKSHPLPENSPDLAYKERAWAADEAYRDTRRAGEESRINTGVVLGGLGLTALAAELAAPIVAAITPTRTAEEQLKHDKGSSWKSWLIPGVASYNRYKRLGRIIAEDAEREAKQQKTASAIEKKGGTGVPGAAIKIIKNPASTGATVENGQIKDKPNGYFEQIDRRRQVITPRVDVPTATPEVPEDLRTISEKEPVEVSESVLATKIRPEQARKNAEAMVRHFKTINPVLGAVIPRTMRPHLLTRDEIITTLSKNYEQGGRENRGAFLAKQRLLPVEQHRKNVMQIHPDMLKEPDLVNDVRTENVQRRATMAQNARASKGLGIA